MNMLFVPYDKGVSADARREQSAYRQLREAKSSYMKPHKKITLNVQRLQDSSSPASLHFKSKARSYGMGDLPAPPKSKSFYKAHARKSAAPIFFDKQATGRNGRRSYMISAKENGVHFDL